MARSGQGRRAVAHVLRSARVPAGDARGRESARGVRGLPASSGASPAREAVQGGRGSSPVTSEWWRISSAGGRSLRRRRVPCNHGRRVQARVWTGQIRGCLLGWAVSQRLIRIRSRTTGYSDDTYPSHIGDVSDMRYGTFLTYPCYRVKTQKFHNSESP